MDLFVCFFRRAWNAIPRGGNLSPTSRRSSSPSRPPQWQRRLLGERAASPARSVSPHPLPISPLVQRRITSGQFVPSPYRVNRGWVTPLCKKTAWIESEGFRRSRSLDTGFPTTEEKPTEEIPTIDVNHIDDHDDDDNDDVLYLVPERATSPPVSIPSASAKERPSRKDRPSLSRLKSGQSITGATTTTTTQAAGTSSGGGGGSEGRRKSRRSTATDDDDSPTFVDRCVTKMKTLISK